jgi:hypothetical protein
MKSSNTKRVLSAVMLSALGVALMSAPALAQRPKGYMRYPGQMQFYRDRIETYPNPVARTGSAEQAQSGAAFGADY